MILWQVLGIWFGYSAITSLLATITNGRLQIGRGRFWNAIASSIGTRGASGFFALWTVFNALLSYFCFWVDKVSKN
jgi:hypothetical protein